MAQAQTLQSINPISLQRTIKRLPHKASGPDRVSYDFLGRGPTCQPAESNGAAGGPASYTASYGQHRHDPQESQGRKTNRPDLVHLQALESGQEARHSQVAALLAMPWDHACPKKDCLSIAVGRMLHTKLCKRNQIHTVTCLADRDSLIQPASELECPLLPLKLAIDLSRGPRVIQAEGIATNPQHYRKGILEGCPQAPAIAKLVLYQPLKDLQRQHPAVILQTWVDDISFDIRAKHPTYVAQEALQAYRNLRTALAQAGLRLNTNKTGLITSSKETATALKALLEPGDPSHYDVFRDLGIDATAAKRRRVPQIRKRFTKGKARAGIMHRLKLNSSIRYRLHRGAVL